MLKKILMGLKVKIPKRLRACIAKNRHMISYKLLAKKIDRNQWVKVEKNVKDWELYNKLISYTWQETQDNFPDYFKGLKYCVEHSWGEVLDIGCGIGTMTKWIVEAKEVKKIIAIDFSQEAIDQLKKYNFKKVYPIRMDLQNLKFEQGQKFDTLVICEVIEHIYPDEEKRMLSSLKPYIHDNTCYIISTPIYWMDDHSHVRGFSKTEFKKHLNRYYGEPEIIDYSVGYRQIAIGKFGKI